MTIIDEIAAERRRQVEAEEFYPKHDDSHRYGEMAGAGACYTMNGLKIQNAVLRSRVGDLVADLWPWAQSWWKPTTRRRDLIKAAALIVAEIERLDRAEATRHG